MKTKRVLVVLFLSLSLTPVVYGASNKSRIFVVSSYHKGYLWSQDTHAGVCAALLDFKFLDNENQVKEYTKKNYVESPKTVIKKVWMDTTIAFFSLLAVTCFCRGIKEEKDNFYLVSGFFVGIAMATKYSGYLSAISILLFALLYQRPLLRNKKFIFSITIKITNT